jgi:hypothetical protein
LRPGIGVAGVHERQPVGAAEAWSRIGGGDVLGHFHHMGDGAAVGATGHQDHVRAHGPNPLDLFVGQPSIVGGQDIDDDGACAQGGALSALAGHVLHHAGDHHLQSAAGAAGGHVYIHTLAWDRPAPTGLG